MRFGRTVLELFITQATILAFLVLVPLDHLPLSLTEGLFGWALPLAAASILFMRHIRHSAQLNSSSGDVGIDTLHDREVAGRRLAAQRVS